MPVNQAKGTTLVELGYTEPPLRNATGELVCILLEPDAAGTARKAR